MKQSLAKSEVSIEFYYYILLMTMLFVCGFFLCYLVPLRDLQLYSAMLNSQNFILCYEALEYLIYLGIIRSIALIPTNFARQSTEEEKHNSDRKLYI